MARDNLMLALDITTALIVLAARAAEAASKITETVSKARAEGRPLTDEEVAAFVQARKDARAEWRATLP